MPRHTLNVYVVRAACAAALSGVLFGFDTAIINGALLFLRDDFHLTELQTELAASSLLVGCVFGAGLVGWLSDKFGRKRILLIAAGLFGISSVCTALAKDLGGFCTARFITGVAIGSASVLAPIYIAEISPPKMRGALVSLNQMAIVIGMLSAFSISWWMSFAGRPSWRFMFALATLPSVAFLISLLFVPESPRWLCWAGRDNLASAILQRIDSTSAASEIKQIQVSLKEETGTWRELLAPNLRRPLIIAIALAVLSQITGINTVNYYGAILFRDHVEHGQAAAALAPNVLLGIVAFISTIVAITIIDRVGRRILLLCGSAGMMVTLCILGWALRSTAPSLLLVVTCVLLYIGLFDLSLGPVTWVCLAELFPNAVRGQAMSAATLALWSACLLVSTTFLTLMRFLSAAGTFWLYAALSAVACLTVWQWVPETKGRSLEEIQNIWRR